MLRRQTLRHNPVLWSHNVGKHLGICLGFEIDAGRMSNYDVCGVGGKVKRPSVRTRPSISRIWLRGLDLNQRPSGYENVLKFTAR
jgi:hypothetical protein